ncbi:MAG: RHS repeat protein, partial [Firmicutes bacterium]|nr:RHS repeat protein [Bacillota bacterium]
MKGIYKLLLILSIFTIFLPIQGVNADTLEEYMNNVVGPKKQYDTELSPVYLKSNLSKENISPNSGELTLTQTDYSLPGRNGLDLEIKRIYKSGTSNVQEMKVKYVNGAWVDYVESNEKTSSFYEDRYNLGVGTRFSFPSIEVRESKDGNKNMFLHTDTGAVYTLQDVLMDDELTYILQGQTVNDVYVRESVEFDNGQSEGTSKYVMMGKDGKKTYFDSEGKILGIVDRYDNTITFQYSTLSYEIDGTEISKKLISKIIDTVGREVTIEYKEDYNFTVSAKQNQQYSKDESYKASQDPNSTDSGDLNNKFQVIINLPGDKKIVYDKSAVLVSDSKKVIRTRLQRVYDTDGKPKYHFWYEQPKLGFTFMNGDDYSVYNGYENLVQIDYCKTNKVTRYTYDTFAKRLNEGSMEYRKIFQRKDFAKKDFDSTQNKFLEKFVLEEKDKTDYEYINESDGYGEEDYERYNNDYLENSYRYYTKITDMKGNETNYTYDGLHQLKETLINGDDYKEVITTEHDEMKLIKKKESLIFNIQDGEEVGTPIKKTQNYRYDEYGNLTNYTGPEAERDEDGNPINDEHMVTYSYAYDKYHVLTSKTWKQDKDTTSQILYDVDDNGNVIKETKQNTQGYNQSIVIEYNYDEYGNMIKSIKHSSDRNYITNYDYEIDADGVDHKGAYLTKKYTVLDNGEISEKYAYDRNTGNITAEINPDGKRTEYQYDTLGRLLETKRPDLTTKEYKYNEFKYKNREIEYTDSNEDRYKKEYDIFGNLVKSSVYDKENEEWTVLKRIEYDNDGNKTKEVDSNGNSVRYEYDSANRLIKKAFYKNDQILTGDKDFSYIIGYDDDTALLVEATDEEGYKTKNYFDILDNLFRVEATPDNKNYFVTSYTYDYVGNKTSTTDPKLNKIQYEFDKLGRMVKKVDPELNETTYVYNSLNKVVIAEEPGGRITKYKYDELGRKIEAWIFPKTSEGYLSNDYIPNNYTYTKYKYNNVGKLSNVIKGNVVDNVDKIETDISYEYNDMDRLTDEYHKIDDNRQSHTHYEYDNKGNNVKTIRYVNQEETKYKEYNYEYYFNNKVKQEAGAYIEVTDDSNIKHGEYVRKYERDNEGNLIKKIDIGNEGKDIVTDFEYDNQNNVTKTVGPYYIDKSSGEVLSEAVNTINYKYDSKGNLLSKKSMVNGEEMGEIYTYDGLNNVLTKSNILGETTRFVCDANSNLVKQVDPRYIDMDIEAAPGIEYEYDSLNRKIKTIAFDGENKKVVKYIEFDGRGNLIKEVDGEGYNTEEPSKSIGNEYEYDVFNNLTIYKSAQTVADNMKYGTNNFTNKYKYNGLGKAIYEEDSKGNKTETEYYLNGMTKKVTFADGTSEEYNYDLTGNSEITKTDKMQHLTKVYNNVFSKPYKKVYVDETYEVFKYDDFGNLKENYDQIKSPKLENPNEYEYNALGKLVSKKQYIAEDDDYKYYKITKNTYDEAGRLLSKETFEYKESKGLNETSTTSAEDKVEYQYDRAGRLIKTYGPMGREITNEYDDTGNLITKKSKIDENNYKITRYEYDTRSQLIKQSLLVDTSDIKNEYLSNAEFDDEYFSKIKSSITYSYYNNGQVKTKEDSLGNIISYKYDYDNRVVEQQRQDEENPIRYEYDSVGNLIKQTNQKSVSVYYEYDVMNRQTRKIVPAADGSLAITKYIYDDMGNLIKQVTPNNYDEDMDTSELEELMEGISYIYDSMNRRIATLSPEGEVIEYIKYDALGRVTKRVDELRYTGDMETSEGVTYKYDSLGRVVEEKLATQSPSSYKYDILGNLVKKTDQRGNSILFEYNPDGTLNKVTYPDSGYITYEYDLLGRKTSQTDQRGYTTFFSYNAFDKQRKLTDPCKIDEAVDNINDLEAIESKYDLNNVLYKYDLNGNVVSVKDKRDTTTLMSYDYLNRVVEKKIPIERDTSGNIIYRIETYEYDEVGNLFKETVSDSKNRTEAREITHTYYDNNLEKTVTNNNGSYIKSYYDKNGNVIKTETLRETGIYDIQKFEYDNQDRLLKEISLINEDDVYNYQDFDNLDNLRDEEYPDKIKIITGYEYDILGNKIKQINSRAYQYGKADEVNREKYTVTFTYDILNRVEKTISMYKGQEVYTQNYYDEAGNKIKVRNAKGSETNYTYDEMNRVKTVTNAKDQTITYTYDLAGNKTAETNDKQNSVYYIYDKLNRVIITKNDDEEVISKRIFDANGNVIKEMDRKGYLSANIDEERYGIQYTYNLANQVVKIVDPEITEYNQENGTNKFTTKYEYNVFGEKIREIDALGNTIKYEYDNGGNLITVLNQLEESTHYTYDKLGNKLTMKNAKNKVTYYRYGAFGALIEVEDQDDNTIKYKYDIAGNQVYTEDKSKNHLIQTFDNRNLLTKKEILETEDKVEYDYDELGNRIEMIDESGVTTYQYNEINQVERIYKDNSQSPILIYSYDTIGNIKTVTDKKGNKTEYEYDKLNRLKTVTFDSNKTTYHYDENGNRDWIDYPGGIKESYEYDKNNKLITITNTAPSGNTISKYKYTYDLAGRQISKTDNYGTTTYEYDEAGRIGKVEAPGKTTVYGYDKAGNRETLNEAYTSEQYSAYKNTVGESVKYSIKKSYYTYSDSNQLLKLVEKMYDKESKQVLQKTIDYIYDNRGNELRQKTSYIRPQNKDMHQKTIGNIFDFGFKRKINPLIYKVSNTYNGFNQLVRSENIKEEEQTIVNYTYDGDGLRTKKIVKSSEEDFEP